MDKITERDYRRKGIHQECKKSIYANDLEYFKIMFIDSFKYGIYCSDDCYGHDNFSIIKDEKRTHLGYSDCYGFYYIACDDCIKLWKEDETNIGKIKK